jgi:hypothetical protein
MDHFSESGAVVVLLFPFLFVVVLCSFSLCVPCTRLLLLRRFPHFLMIIVLSVV